MGTLFEVLLSGDDEENLTAIADAVLDEVQRIDRLLSRFDPRSEISRINRVAGQRPLLIDREIAGILFMCLEAWRRTGGLFDVAARSRSAGLLTDPPFELDADGRLVWLASPDMQLDLGGIGKGYALERATDLLAGVPNALIHGGTSSVIARGFGINDEPWRIALRHPASGQVVSQVELRDAALSCSAANNQNDIIDPRTGQLPTDSLACAVIAPSATEAEILSTALVCLGREPGERLVEQYAAPKVQCIWID